MPWGGTAGIYLRNRALRWLAEKTMGISARAPLPGWAGYTFRGWWKKYRRQQAREDEHAAQRPQDGPERLLQELVPDGGSDVGLTAQREAPVERVAVVGRRVGIQRHRQPQIVVLREQYGRGCKPDRYCDQRCDLAAAWSGPPAGPGFRVRIFH